jgi:hypothetical protein
LTFWDSSYNYLYTNYGSLTITIEDIVSLIDCSSIGFELIIAFSFGNYKLVNAKLERKRELPVFVKSRESFEKFAPKLLKGNNIVAIEFKFYLI